MNRLTRLVDRWPLLIVLAWVFAAVWMTVAAPSVRELGTADQTAFVPASAPSGRADALLRTAFPDDPTRDPAVVVLARPTGLTPADRAYVSSLSRFLTSPAAAEHVKGVQTAATAPELAPVLRSGDGAAELLIVSLKAQVFTVTAQDSVQFLREYLDSTAPPGLHHEVTGLAALAADQADAILDAFDRTALATVALVLLILLLVYRSALAPLISLVSVLCAFAVARGAAGYLAEAGLGVASLAETFMVVMAFGAGTDYVMFVLSRYREAGRTAETRRRDLSKATRAVAPTIIASGATVSLAFLAFLAAELGLLRSMGPVLAIAIAVTVPAALTLTPALLRLAGPAVFWPSPESSPQALERQRRRWERLAALVSRRPAAVLTAGLMVLAVPALAATTVRPSFDIPAELPATAEARQGFELLAEHYPSGLVAPAFLVVSGRGTLLNQARMRELDRLVDALAARPDVAEVRSVTQPVGRPLTADNIQALSGGKDLSALGIDPDRVDVGPLLAALQSPRGLRLDAAILEQYPQLRERLGYFLDSSATTTRIVVALKVSPYSPTALDFVRDLDEWAATELAGGPLAGAQLAVAGPSAYFGDIQDLMDGDLVTVGALALAVVFIVLALLLRSLVAPIYLLASVVLSMLAALGITAVVFQDLLGNPGVAFFLPVLLFVMLVALGSDYNIFITGRIREEIDAGRSVADATREALVITGPTITAAGMVLAGTFGAMLITPIANVRQLGFGVAVGVLIDTFIVRSLVVPAATILLGKHAFWPSTGLPVAKPVRWARPAAGTAVLGIATALGVVAFSGRGGDPVVEVATATAAAPPARVGNAAPASPRPPAVSSAPASLPPRAEASTRKTAAPAAARPSDAALRKSPKLPRSPKETERPRSRSVGPAKPPAIRIASPALGNWRYRATGSRSVGAAGSDVPFDEEATSQVERTGGTERTPQLEVTTRTSFATLNETRRYRPGTVEALEFRVSAAGLAYGGRFDPPQVLLSTPIRIGAERTSRWVAEGVRGSTRTTVVEARRVTVDGRAVDCYLVDRRTTLTGDVEGEQRQRTCWAPSLGMAATDDLTVTGTYRGIPFTGTVRLSLIAPPQGEGPSSGEAVQPRRAQSGLSRGGETPLEAALESLGDRRVTAPVEAQPVERLAWAGYRRR
ncbi:MAG: MMPL family transporter [Sporichthyaceae bacterium]